MDVDWTNVDIREKVLESKRLASDVQRSLYRTLQEENPTLRDRGVKKASYVVLTGTTMPAVLAEVSFVSSPSDEAHLRTPAYRQQIAEAIYKGISGFKAETRKVTLAKRYWWFFGPVVQSSTFFTGPSKDSLPRHGIAKGALESVWPSANVRPSADITSRLKPDLPQYS